jgi:MinD superfamily P-loop ATPase
VELVILSGKGGTGKTSLVGSLAVMAENKVLVDCDVDAADLHLILDAETEQDHSFVASSRASIDDEKCTGCGICENMCRFDAVKMTPDPNAAGGVKFEIDKYACEGCGVCRHFCPEDAIAFEPVESGRWFLSETRYGPLVHARLGIAEGNSGRLVSLLRRTAQELAEKENRDLTIIDGPPGIGCPVIASMTGADYILIVSEPSKSAFHDLDRLLQLVAHFDIPAGLCINKYDINSKLAAEMERYADSKGIAILARIPFDPRITKAQVAGRPFVENGDNETTRALRDLWEKLQEELKNSVDNKTKSKLINIENSKL